MLLSNLLKKLLENRRARRISTILILKIMKKYNKYIESIEWKEKRIYIINQRNWICERCGNDKFLQIHHWSYKNLWKELDNELFCLCKKCHKEFHSKYWFKNLLKSTRNFIEDKPIKISSTIRTRSSYRISRKEANLFVPTQEFISYVVSGGKYSWNEFTKSIRVFNSVVRRYFIS